MATIVVQASTVSFDDTAFLDAINSANNGDTIEITGSGQIALTAPLTIDKDITIEGNLLAGGTPLVTIEAVGLGTSTGSYSSGSNALITIASGADVSISNLILSGGGQTDDAPDGADGDDGDDGEDGADGSGDTGGVGTAGGSGVGATVNAANAVGTIDNKGALTLTSDLVTGTAIGGKGGAGGRGGDGGAGGTGGSGVDNENGTGGTGGDGGTGGLGGSGGDGSNGGNATGGILNESGATLNLSDTIIADASAQGGAGGGGGDAGFGGSGGAGGAGGNGTVGGNGGDGGNGNNGGNGGDGGSGGSSVGAINNEGAITVAGAALVYFNDVSAPASGGAGGFLGGVGGGGEGGEAGNNGEGQTGAAGGDGGFGGNNGTAGAAGSATANVAGSTNGLTVEDGWVGTGTFVRAGAAYYTFAQTQPQNSTIQLTAQQTAATFTYDVDMVGDTADGGSIEWTVGGPSQLEFANHKNSGTVTFSPATGAISGFNGIEGSFTFTLDVDPSVPEVDFAVVLTNPGGTGTSTSPQGVLGASTSLDEIVLGGTQTPAITGITAQVTGGPTPYAGYAMSGDTVEIDIAFSDSPLEVIASSPTLTPILKLGTLSTSYVSTQTDLNDGILAFDYVVAKNQKLTALKVSSLTLPKGVTVTDEAGNAANLKLPPAEEGLGISADGVVPVVESVTVSPSRGPVAEGTIIAFTLRLNEDAIITGNPTLALSDGEVATYFSGRGTTAMVFHYTVGAETTSDLKITGINQSAGNVITDIAGNPLSSVLSDDLKLQIGVPPTPKVTGITAQITGGPTPNAGYAVAGDTVEIDVALSDSPLEVTGGDPVLKLGTLATTYASTQTDLTNGVLAFDYTVANNQRLTALKVSSLTLPKGVTITDQSGNPANLKLTTAEEALGISADGVAPTVTSARATSTSKIVVTGDTVLITLAMNEAVTVTGTPTLSLNDGGTASYISTGTGGKSLVFSYLVQSGETSTDLKTTALNEPNGATINDTLAGNAMSPTSIANLGLNLKLKINPPSPAKPLDAGLALFVNAIAGFASAGGHGDAAIPPATTEHQANDLAQPHT